MSSSSREGSDRPSRPAPGNTKEKEAPIPHSSESTGQITKSENPNKVKERLGFIVRGRNPNFPYKCQLCNKEVCHLCFLTLAVLFLSVIWVRIWQFNVSSTRDAHLQGKTHKANEEKFKAQGNLFKWSNNNLQERETGLNSGGPSQEPTRGKMGPQNITTTVTVKKQKAKDQQPALEALDEPAQEPKQTESDIRRLKQMTLAGARRTNVDGSNRAGNQTTATGGAEEEEGAPLKPIEGTCEDLEKSFFRLTSAPEPSEVRPRRVVERALERLEGMGDSVGWHYANDQLKAMRQDLIVQHIRDGLTVRVYEHHARRALDAHAWQEYTNCQQALRHLYSEGIEGNESEFVAYRILWSAATAERAVSTATGVARSSQDEALSDLLAAVRWRARGRCPSAVEHAMSVRCAAVDLDVPMFIHLYEEAPNRSGRIMELHLHSLRLRAASALCRSVRPKLPVSEFARLLGFSDSGDCALWLEARSASLCDDGVSVDCKASSGCIKEAPAEEASQLGRSADTLALQDFMAK